MVTTTPTGGMSFDVSFASQELGKIPERVDDPPLTEKGCGQARVTAKHLHDMGVVRSSGGAERVRAGGGVELRG